MAALSCCAAVRTALQGRSRLRVSSASLLHSSGPSAPLGTRRYLSPRQPCGYVSGFGSEATQAALLLVMQPGKFHQIVIFLICKMKQRIVQFSEAGGCSLLSPPSSLASWGGVGCRAEAGLCPGLIALGVIFTWAQLPDGAWHSALSNSYSGTAEEDEEHRVGGCWVLQCQELRPFLSLNAAWLRSAASPPCRLLTGSRTVFPAVPSAVLPHRQEAARLGTLAELLG